MGFELKDRVGTFMSPCNMIRNFQLTLEEVVTCCNWGACGSERVVSRTRTSPYLSADFNWGPILTRALLIGWTAKNGLQYINC